MSPLGRLPAEWLSHCLSFLDLHALLAAGSVSVHWRASQQSRAAWTCSSLEEGCSRAWSPVSFAQLAAPPPVFRRLLCAMRVDMELLAPLRDEDDEGEFDYDGQAQFDPARHAHAWPTLPLPAATVHPIPVAFVRSLFDSFAALRCLSVRDAQEVLAHDEISDLCRLAVERLRQISIERDEFKPAAMLGPLLQPPHDTRTQLSHIRLHTDAIGTAVVSLPLSSMDALLALPSALESPSSHGAGSCPSASSASSSTAISAVPYSWPLIPSLTALTITIAEARMLRLLSQLQQLTALDLDVKFEPTTDEQRSECDAAWSSLHSVIVADLSQRSSRVVPSNWVHSLHTLHLSTLRLSDATVIAVSQLSALMDLVIAGEWSTRRTSTERSCSSSPCADWR